MTTNNSFLGISYTVWSLIGIGAYNALSSVAPQLQGTVGTVANIILLVLAGYMHSSHVQNAVITGSVK